MLSIFCRLSGLAVPLLPARPSAEFRSIPYQIEYWAKFGKCTLDNPDL